MNRSLGYLAFFALCITGLTVSIDYLVRVEMAKTYLEYVDRSIKLGDFRETALFINSRLDHGHVFTAVEMNDAGHREIFHLPPEHQFTHGFEGQITIPSPDNEKIFVFWYALWQPAVFSAFICGVVGLIGALWLKSRERQIRIAAFMEKKVETADLLAQVSHDMNSPLSTINLAVGGLSGVETERRDLILHASRRINDIAGSLLRRMKDDSLMAQREDVELCGLAKRVLNEKRLEHQTKNVSFLTDFSEPALEASLAPGDLTRVLSNLINNAVEAGATKVTLSLQDRGRMIALTVTDNGPGIPKSVLRRIGKEPITAGKSGGRSGYGLGLWSAHLFAFRYKGKLTISSSERGTQVILSIRK